MSMLRVAAFLLFAQCTLGQFFYATTYYSSSSCTGEIIQTTYDLLDVCLYDGTAYTISVYSSGSLQTYSSCSSGCVLSSCSQSTTSPPNYCDTTNTPFKITGPTILQPPMSGIFVSKACSSIPLISSQYIVESLSTCFGPSSTGKYLEYDYSNSEITQNVCDAKDPVSMKCKTCTNGQKIHVDNCTNIPGSGQFKFYGGKYLDDLLTQYIKYSSYATSSCTGGSETTYVPAGQCLSDGVSYSQYNLNADNILSSRNCTKGCFYCDSVTSSPTSSVCAGSQHTSPLPSFITSVNDSSLIYVQYFSDSDCGNVYKLRVDNTSVCAQVSSGYVKSSASSTSFSFSSCTDISCTQCTSIGTIPADGSCSPFEGKYVRAATSYPLAPLPSPITSHHIKVTTSTSSTGDLVATSTSHAVAVSFNIALVGILSMTAYFL